MIGLVVALVLTAAGSSIDPARETIVVAHRRASSIDFTCNDRLLATYRFAPDQKYPYFYPIVGPRSRQSLTAESSRPYPHHHSLFFACDRVDGGNYWQEGTDRGQILQTALEILRNEAPAVIVRTENEWRRPGSEPPLRDVRRLTLRARPDGGASIDFEISLRALKRVTILCSNHALFSARMAPDLAVDAGGHLVDSVGRSGEAATFGRRALWMSAWGDRGAGREGLAILTHPSDRFFPYRWFTRDYGFFSPTPMHWLPDEGLRLAKGETLHLRYRVIAHAGDPREAGVPASWRRWTSGSDRHEHRIRDRR